MRELQARVDALEQEAAAQRKMLARLLAVVDSLIQMHQPAMPEPLTRAVQ